MVSESERLCQKRACHTHSSAFAYHRPHSSRVLVTFRIFPRNFYFLFFQVSVCRVVSLNFEDVWDNFTEKSCIF